MTHRKHCTVEAKWTAFCFGCSIKKQYLAFIVQPKWWLNETWTLVLEVFGYKFKAVVNVVVILVIFLFLLQLTRAFLPSLLSTSPQKRAAVITVGIQSFLMLILMKTNRIHMTWWRPYKKNSWSYSNPSWVPNNNRSSSCRDDSSSGTMNTCTQCNAIPSLTCGWKIRTHFYSSL